MKLPNQQSSHSKKRKLLHLKSWLNKNDGALLIFILIAGALITISGLYLVERDFHFGTYIEFIGTIVCAKVVIEIIDINIIHRKITKLLFDITNESNEKSNKELLEKLTPLISNAKKMNSLGIIDLYEHLDFKEILERVQISGGRKLSAQRLYFSGEEFKLLRENISKHIINDDCSFELLLFSPMEINTIKRRVRFIPNTEEITEDTLDSISHGTADIIKFQLKVFYKIKNNLPVNKRDKLQIKFHRNFVVAAVTSYDDKIIHCPYLSDRSADEAIHIEVKGRDTKLYKEWWSHFETNWRNAYSYEVVSNEIRPVGNTEQNCKVGNKKTKDECLKNKL